MYKLAEFRNKLLIKTKAQNGAVDWDRSQKVSELSKAIAISGTVASYKNIKEFATSEFYAWFLRMEIERAKSTINEMSAFRRKMLTGRFCGYGIGNSYMIK